MQVERAVVFAEREGFRALEIDIYRPDERVDGLRPLLVYVHGGGWRVRATAAGRRVRLAVGIVGSSSA